MLKLTLKAENARNIKTGIIVGAVDASRYLVKIGKQQLIATSHVSQNLVDGESVTIVGTEQGWYITGSRDLSARKEKEFIFDG